MSFKDKTKNKSNPKTSNFGRPGMNITTPLRCACPVTSQRCNGVKYLLSYLVDMDDTAMAIGQRLSVNYTTSILDANNSLSDSCKHILPSQPLSFP